MILTYDDYLDQSDKTFAISTLNKKDYKKGRTNNDDFTYPLTPVGYALKIGLAIIKKWDADKDGVGGYNYDNKIEIQNIPKTDPIDTKEDAAKQSEIVIPAKSGAIVVTLDAIYLSGNVAGTVHARSTLSAQGLIMNSFTVDPNYKGRLVFYVFNSSQKEMTLFEKETIATLILHQTITHTEEIPKKNTLDEVIENYKSCDGDTEQGNEVYGHLKEYIDHVEDSKTHSDFDKQCIKVNEHIGTQKKARKHRKAIYAYLKRKFT
ncbi:MAG: hypothetical protein Q9M25_00745 [Mariprofundaceae bacterium]|nr:hypothetical protein [Mariprofundaceae bacterium]